MTHTTKHTPGPWVVETWDYTHANPPRKELNIQTSTNLLATVQCDFTGSNPYTIPYQEAQANAALIAAAPAMYEALKGCLRVTEAWKSQAEMDGDTVEIEAAVMEIKRIKAALAQAEGSAK